MLKRHFVEQFLRLNNISKDTPHDEIHDLLRDAQWSDAEIENAITVISADPAESSTAPEKDEHTTDIFQHNFSWSSEQLSTLLGVDVVVNPATFRGVHTKKRSLKEQRVSVVIGIVVIILALVLAALLGISVAYMTESGPFHVAAEELIF